MMPSTTNSLDEAAQMLRDRLGELDGEKRRIEGALGALTTPARRRGRPRGSRDGSPRRQPRRRRRSNTRADQAVKLIEGKPGISAADIAKTMKIKPNYLYRVLGSLEEEGRVKKDGRRYFPKG